MTYYLHLNVFDVKAHNCNTDISVSRKKLGIKKEQAKYDLYKISHLSERC